MQKKTSAYRIDGRPGIKNMCACEVVVTSRIGKSERLLSKQLLRKVLMLPL